MRSITGKITSRRGQNSQSEVGVRIQSNLTLKLHSAGPGMSLAIDQTPAFNLDKTVDGNPRFGKKM